MKAVPGLKKTNRFKENFTFATNNLLSTLVGEFNRFLSLVKANHLPKSRIRLLLRQNLANLADPLRCFSIGNATSSTETESPDNCYRPC